MKSRKSYMILLVAFVLALGAGVTGGVLYSRLPVQIDAPQPQPPAMGPAHLAEELRLTAEERQRMRGLWQGVQTTVQACFDDARVIQSQREDALIDLLTPEQKARFAAIAQEYAGRFDAVVKRRDQAFADAVEQTRQMLDPTRRKIYDKILEQRAKPAATRAGTGEDLLVPPALLGSRSR